MRLRVKLTVLANKQRQSESQDSNGKRKKLKGTSDSPSNVTPTAAGVAGGETSGTEGAQTRDPLEPTPATTTTGLPAVARLEENPHQEPSQQNIEHDGSQGHNGKTTVSRQYQLCQYGHPEPGRNIVVRSAILVKIHGDAFGFLSLLGYGYGFSLLVESFGTLTLDAACLINFFFDVYPLRVIGLKTSMFGEDTTSCTTTFAGYRYIASIK